MPENFALRRYDGSAYIWRRIGGSGLDIPIAPEWIYPSLVELGGAENRMGTLPEPFGVLGIKNVGTGVVRAFPSSLDDISGLTMSAGSSLTGKRINGDVVMNSGCWLYDCEVKGHITAASGCNLAGLENTKVIGRNEIRGGGLISTDSAAASETAFVVRFCDLDATLSGGGRYGTAIGPRRYTLERSYIKGVVDGISWFPQTAGQPVYIVVRGNYFDLTSYFRPDPFGVQSDGTHGDTGGQFQGGSGGWYYGNVVIGFNNPAIGNPTLSPTYINPTSWSNAGLMFNDNVGALTGLRVFGNYLSGGAATANLGPMDSNDTGIIFKMNLLRDDSWPTFAYAIDRAAGNPAGIDFGSGALRNFFATGDTWESTGVLASMRA